MTDTAALRTVDLAVGYRTRNKRFTVLSGLNAAVHAGELVCLLGPNGIGKSTFLRTISRIQPSLLGSVDIDGTDIRRLNQLELARKIGVVLTERIAVGAMSGRQIVEIGRYPHVSWSGRLAPHDHDVVEWAIEAVGASHLAERDINKLSDGERQRLMIARAMAQEPVILILDEPTAFLDVASRVELMGLLRALAREQNLAVLVSTHDLELALHMSDTIWLLAPGGRLQCGTPEDLIAAGSIEAAFHSDGICFRPEERIFRPVAETSRRAIVEGNALAAALARALMEREGYAVVRGLPAEIVVTFASSGFRWTATAGGAPHSGQTFSDLAKLARELSASDSNCR